MRFAGQAIQQAAPIEQKPVLPGFNPEDLQYTPELPAPTMRQEYQRDNYILRPRSGVAMQSNGEQGTEVAGLFNIFDWSNGNNQKDIERMDAGSDEPITNQGKVGNTIMNRNRKLNQMLNEL